MIRVAAINGSPRAEKGYTAMLMDPLIQGMRDAGAEVNIFYAKRFKVKPCTGEMHCWYRKPGKCYIRDDMQKVYPVLREADILVLATPVYIPLPGEMQNIMNRMCPLVIPELQTRDRRTRARFRDDVKIKKVALVATGAWWEKENLDTVVRIARRGCQCGIRRCGAPPACLSYEAERRIDKRRREDPNNGKASRSRTGREGQYRKEDSGSDCASFG